MCKYRRRDEKLPTITLVFRFVMLSVLAGYAIFCLVSSSQAFNHLVQIGTDYTNLIRSWEEEVVTDIKRNDNDCSSLNAGLSRYHRDLGEYKPLFLLNYPGFINGCDCRNA